jgi:uncharacterized RDD family membrane protein YckC
LVKNTTGIGVDKNNLEQTNPDLSRKLPVQPSDPIYNRKETRQIVTPYAFHVSSELFGTPLASPSKRAIAIGIDGLVLGMLTQASGFLLAGFAAATFFRAGNRLKQKKRFNGVRITLRFLTAILLFVFVMGLVDEINFEDRQDNHNSSKSVAGGLATVGGAGKTILKLKNIDQQIKDKSCTSYKNCWDQIADELTDDLVEHKMSQEEALEIINVIIDFKNEFVTDGQLNEIKQPLIELYNTKATNISKLSQEKSNTVGIPIVQVMDEPSNTASAVEWIKGILDDLGLGFGWAAFYFSVFTAWWKGQTPGKKLVGIKVLKLDNTELTLWESFGRYGGYGAGFATGLMGFLQVFWDPNRRAIQDKISETLVIDIRKNKQEFPLKE